MRLIRASFGRARAVAAVPDDARRCIDRHTREDDRAKDLVHDDSAVRSGQPERDGRADDADQQQEPGRAFGADDVEALAALGNCHSSRVCPAGRSGPPNGSGYAEGPGRIPGPLRVGGARYWDRTSDLFRVREARYRCANRACTGVFSCPARWRRDSNPCKRLCRPVPSRSATPPCGLTPRAVIPPERNPCTRADDETRTRDPNLGKVVRYQLRYIRVLRIAPGA
jgi:hypothetical protein